MLSIILKLNKVRYIMVIDNNLLDKVTEKAKESNRLRMNYNLHDSLDAKVQRLLNALEPGTILPIHRHTQTDETYIVLRGSINVIFYNENKNPENQFSVNPKEGVYGIHIPSGQWHTLEVIESGTVIFEVKEGPYALLGEEDILDVL
jgi:cupin fold WbuC family metalloprotein